MKKALLILAAIGLISFCSVSLVGSLIVWNAYRQAERRFQHDCELAAPALADPPSRRLLTLDFPSAGFYLDGPVATKADYDRLRAEMTRFFGEERVSHVMTNVWVEAKTETAPAPRQSDSQK